MLYLIGLGLNNEKDITVNGLEVVKRAERVYLEAYTAILLVDKDKLVCISPHPTPPHPIYTFRRTQHTLEEEEEEGESTHSHHSKPGSLLRAGHHPRRPRNGRVLQRTNPLRRPHKRHCISRSRRPARCNHTHRPPSPRTQPLHPNPDHPQCINHECNRSDRAAVVLIWPDPLHGFFHPGVEAVVVV